MSEQRCTNVLSISVNVQICCEKQAYHADKHVAHCSDVTNWLTNGKEETKPYLVTWQ